jgi:predicted DNA-binding transcriptional regulator AlpA
MGKMEIKSKLLSNADAAAYLGISPGTLANWRANGDGPRVTWLGRLVRYSLAELDLYIEKNTKSA